MVISCIKDPFYKITSEALGVAQCAVKVMRPAGKGFVYFSFVTCYLFIYWHVLSSCTSDLCLRIGHNCLCNVSYKCVHPSGNHLSLHLFINFKNLPVVTSVSIFVFLSVFPCLFHFPSVACLFISMCTCIHYLYYANFYCLSCFFLPAYPLLVNQ